MVLFGVWCWSLGVHGSKVEKHSLRQWSQTLMIGISVFFGENTSQTLWRFVCVCVCINVFLRLVNSYFSFTKILGSLWYCWPMLHQVHLGIIALDVHWIINRKLKVLIQDLLMAQTFNPSPWIQSIITIIIRQVTAIYENFSEEWAGTKIKTLSLLAVLDIPDKDVIIIYSTIRWEGWDEIWLSGSANLITFQHYVMFFWSLIKCIHCWRNVFKCHWKKSGTILPDWCFLLICFVSINLMELQCIAKMSIWRSPIQMCDINYFCGASLLSDCIVVKLFFFFMES